MDTSIAKVTASEISVEEQSWDSHSPVRARSNRHRRKRLPKAASTPVSNYPSKTSSISTTQYQSTLDDTWVHDKAFVRSLKQLEKLEQSWTAACTKSCQSFIHLATVLLQCAQCKIPDNISTSEYPVDALVLLRQGQIVQGTKLCQGFAVERGFSQVQKYLRRMQDCSEQLTAWRTRLTALCNLLKDQSISPGNTSMMDYRAQLILWPAVLGETGGLLTQLNRDLRARNDILSQAPGSCQSAREAHRLSLLWRHLGTLVRWNSVINLVKQLLEILE